MTTWYHRVLRKNDYEVAIERLAVPAVAIRFKEGHRSHEPADAGWRVVRRKSRHDDGGTAGPQTHLRFFDN